VAVALERAARAIGQVVDGKALGRRNPARERNRGHALTLPTPDRLLDHESHRSGYGQLVALSSPWFGDGSDPEASRPKRRLAAYLALSRTGDNACVTTRVLVVDDDPAVRSAISRALRVDYDVDEAGDGADALARHAASPADAIVLDLLMPEIGGRDAHHSREVARHQWQHARREERH